MNTLHLVARRLERDDERAAVLAAEDAVVWLEEGVTAALASASPDLDPGLAQYVLQPDLDRRGLGQRALRDGVKAIDYDDLVALVVAYPRSFTW